jgi:hypothetical protein
MGSPVSSTLAEIYLQFFVELTIRHWMKSGEILYYTRYVDNNLITFDKTNEDSTTNYMKNIYKYLEFTLTEGEK